MMSGRTGRVATVILASAILLVGCTGPAEPDSHGDQPEPGPESLRAEAEAGGASQEQLDVIDKGSDVSFSDYEQAVNRTISCMTDAGIDVIGNDVADYRGLPEIRYSFAASSDGRTDEETLKVADACMYTHSYWIEALYQSSPSSVQAIEARFAPYREPLTACIEEQGAEVEANLNRDELLTLSYDTLDRTGIDCVKTVGVPQ